MRRKKQKCKCLKRGNSENGKKSDKDFIVTFHDKDKKWQSGMRKS